MRRQDGFTLIEILLVVLVIGILAAIALPAFLGQRDKGQDAEAKSNAGNVRVHVEACVTQGDNTYLDCATAVQIESTELPVGMLLPPLNQFAAAGGNGNGNTDNNGIKNGAQCIEQSNGTRACEQTSGGGGSTGGGTGTTTTPTTTTPTTTTPTTTTTTTTTTTDTSAADSTTTGGSAPDVGDCVEGGTVEVGCVGIVTTASGYTITAVSKSTHVFKIVKGSAGLVTRPCQPAGSGGCPAGGSW